MSISTATTTERGFSQQASRIADTHGIEKVSSPFGGGNFWYKNPSPEKLESIYKLRLKPEEKVPIAKNSRVNVNPHGSISYLSHGGGGGK